MICVSISKVSYDLAAEYARKYPFVEFRLETLPISLEEAGNLFSIAERSVSTCRPMSGQEERREKVLKIAIESGTDFVDLEIDEIEANEQTLTDIRERVQRAETKLIISYHNFKKTPQKSELETIYEKAIQYGADIVKIACAVHHQEDNLRLLSLCTEYQPVLAIGMGPMGIFTRVLGPFLGNPFTFAHPDDQSPTAPGQLSYSRMKTLQTELKELFHGKS